MHFDFMIFSTYVWFIGTYPIEKQGTPVFAKSHSQVWMMRTSASVRGSGRGQLNPQVSNQSCKEKQMRTKFNENIFLTESV
jgi:hypothetical protein